MSTNYRMNLQYDGSRFGGWQKQKDTDMTIQGKLETVLGRITEEEVQVNGSGRTDAGVHALAQTASFKLERGRDAGELLAGLNRYLPEDIRILSLEEAPERFHARLSAVRKTYCYHVDTGSKKDVFERKYVYGFPFELELEPMKQAGALLLGTHDFMSFCGNKRMKKSAVRTLESVEIRQDGSRFTFTFTGNGFLLHMVRILTGTLIEIGQGRRTPGSMKEILEAKERSAAGFTAPPEGLFLQSVEYGSD